MSDSLNPIVVGRLRRFFRGGVIDEDLAQEIFLYRANRGVTQQELAQQAGTHSATIWHAEHARPLSMKVRAKLRRFFDQVKRQAVAEEAALQAAADREAAQLEAAAEQEL